MLLRIIYFIVFFLSGLLFPWWLTVFAGVAGVFLFPTYFEALFVGLFLDILYGGGAVLGSFFFPFFYTLIFLVCLAVSEFIRSKVQYF